MSKLLLNFMLITTFLFCGCLPTSQKEMLIGVWESEGKVIEFTDTEFVSINKNAKKALAFKGTYSFAKTPANALKMNYLEVGEDDGYWTSLADTEIGIFTDIVLIQIQNKELHIKVLGNDKIYIFTKIKLEDKLSK